MKNEDEDEDEDEDEENEENEEKNEVEGKVIIKGCTRHRKYRKRVMEEQVNGSQGRTTYDGRLY